MTSINEFLTTHSYRDIKDVSELSKFIVSNINESGNDATSKPEEEVAKEQAQKTDDAKVTYAPKNLHKNIFSNIIVFTNDTDPKKNKTLKNILDAIAKLDEDAVKPELYCFVAEKVTFTADDDNILTISDGKTELELSDESNIDTLVFSRLGVQGENNCEHVVKMLQDKGFLVLNPVRYSELASNKYDTCCLLEKAEIPQPNYCLMTKHILYDDELFNESMKRIESGWNETDTDKNEKYKLVVKILDGHGGTGVALTDGKKLRAWLQFVFAVDPERELLIQRKEEGDGGDIRVHVLTLRNKQVILGAMKRVKLGGDFRSNVSLGAEAEPIKLTPEQEQIALKTAKVSGLPWCAVDIMPLVKGSNKELGDNVVLEINASPGTDGITKVLKHNFINILLSQLDDPKEFVLQDKTCGWMESVEVDFGKGDIELLAKLDTGNGASASHVEVGEIDDEGDYVRFTLGGKKYKLKKIGTSNALVGDVRYERPVVEIPMLKLGQRKINNIRMALVKRREGKSANMLINRDVMSWLGYCVNPSKTHILTPEMEKLKII